MDLELVFQIAGSLGLLLAATGLVLTVLELRLLGRTIRGNTYHLMALHALEVQKVLLDKPGISYLYADQGPRRDQAIFNNILGNYIETMWIQMSNELIDAEAHQAFEGLLRKYAEQHREVFNMIITGENYAPGLRSHAQSLLDEVTAQTNHQARFHRRYPRAKPPSIPTDPK